MAKSSTISRSIQRPWGVTLLAVVVLTIATLNLVRGWQAIAQRSFLAEILAIPWLYLASTGLVWGVIGLVLFVGLWQGYAWAPNYTPITTLLYSVYSWVDRLLVATERTQTNWQFALTLNLILVLATFGLLYRRKTRTFFGDWHDR